MTQQPSDHESLNRNVNRVIGVSLLAAALINAGIVWAIATAIAQKGIGNPDRIEFARLFLSTFSLSMTLLVAVGTLAVLRAYGYSWPWWASVFLIAVGAAIVGLPMRPYTHGHIFTIVVEALRAFIERYGMAFYAGEVAGVASGIILGLVAEHYRLDHARRHARRSPLTKLRWAFLRATLDSKAATELERSELFPHRPPQPWRLEVGFLILMISMLTVFATVGY